MELGKIFIFFLLCAITMVINGGHAFHVSPSAGKGSLDTPPKSFSTGTSLHVLDVYKSYSDAQALGQQLRYGPSATIRSFSSKGELLAEGHQLYDVTTIPSEEEIVGAELHFFISEIRNILKLPSEIDSVKIQLFVVEEEFPELIEERTVRANDFGWQVFNVKSTIEKWHGSPIQNQGFKVKVLDSSEKDISSDIIGSWQRSYEPVLIVFSENLHMPESMSQSIGSQISNRVESLLKNKNMPVQTARKIRSVTNVTQDLDSDDRNNHTCQRRELRLSFEDIGWNFIIYPSDFDASFCSGFCSAPQKVENYHDFALCSAYEFGEIPHKLIKEFAYCQPRCRPSCGAIQYESLRIIYKDDDVLKSEMLPNMIVTDCGCQKM